MDRIRTIDVARGRWKRILPELGIPRKALTGRHGPCLFCGGKDRARFTDWKGEGSYLCNQCGNYPGFKLLQKFHGWDFKRAAAEVDRVLATNATVSMSNDTYRQYQEANNDYSIPKATRDCALWLRKFRPAQELEDWLQTKTPEVRHWLEEQS